MPLPYKSSDFATSVMSLPYPGVVSSGRGDKGAIEGRWPTNHDSAGPKPAAANREA